MDLDPVDHAVFGDNRALFRDALGPHVARFDGLDEAMKAAHPNTVRHAYLPLVAVHPDRQGQGVGAALLGHALAGLDRAGLPAHLEASSARSVGLYQRLGFTPLPDGVALPGGPRLYPMWRDPRPVTPTDDQDDAAVTQAADAAPPHGQLAGPRNRVNTAVRRWHDQGMPPPPSSAAAWAVLDQDPTGAAGPFPVTANGRSRTGTVIGRDADAG